MGRRGRWIVLSLALAVALAILDVLVTRPVLITALVAPPLVAAGRVGPRATAVVGAVCLALAVSLGLRNGMPVTSGDAVRLAVVAGGGVLAVWVSGLGQQLARSRDQLRAILEGVADAVVARNRSGESVFANRAALELLQFDSEAELQAFPGEPVTDRFDVVDEDGRPVSADDLPGRRAARGESPPPQTVRLRSRATGDERWVVVKAAPIRAETGRDAMAIVIVEDITEVKRLERRERLLAESGRLLGESLDYERTLRAVAGLTVPDLADCCAVHGVDEHGVIRLIALVAADRAAEESLRELRERYPPELDAGYGPGLAARTGTSTLYRDIRPDTLEKISHDPEHLHLLRALNPRSAIVVPMTARGRSLGAVSFITLGSGRRFDDFALGLAEELAERMGMAVDNARLYRERGDIARALQESLLPPTLPEVPGLEVAARFRAAGTGSEVGGDFYDLFQSGESLWSVAIGDVCGKGADAAAVTALARYTIRTAAMSESRPSAVLATLNEAMLRQRHDEQFCTVAFASIEPGASGASVTVASGGHPLPLLLRADGRVSRVGRSGTLLGVVDDPAIEDEHIRMETGDSLVFYTDGVTEGHAPERIVTADELATVLSSCAGLDAATVAERLERHSLPAEREPRDDVAVLVLRLRGLERAGRPA
jgi:PAS domain S-box-containing protein